MNAQSPPRPLHVPTLTEVVDAPPGLGLPAAVQDELVAQLAPAADVETGADGGAEVPRNLLRGAPPSSEVVTNLGGMSPPPMSAGLAMPQSGATPSPEALQAARDSLSGALRSARDGRWAPMPNVELPAMEVLLDEPPHPVAPPMSQGQVFASAQMALPEVQSSTVPPTVPPAVLASEITEVTEVSEAQLAHRVLGVVQKQIDGMLDFRLREALTPILQRHTDALVRELRDELKQTMQDVINRAVAQEMAKVRPR